MSGILRNISTVSLLTIVSRVLGLLRDILFFSCFGVSATGAAFILAFTLPNLFRRMLGEGTLSSAFIPVYSETKKNGSEEQAQEILNQVLSRLFLFLLIISIVVCLGSFFVSGQDMLLGDKWVSGLSLNSIIFPYVLFICVSAIMVGALNANGKFFAGAFSPIILNFSMICCLLIFYFLMGWRDFKLAIALCFSVLVGGVFQMIWPWFQLRKSIQWRWVLDFSSSEGTEKIKSLFFIGIFGAAVGQINIIVSRILAYSLDNEGALSYLFISARLIELPLGVFAISISTVFFPELSRSFASGGNSDFQKCFTKGFRLTLAITLPAAVGLACLSEPILRVLFLWGEFGSGDVELGARVLLVSSFALPFYALAAYLVKAFHSRKEMKIPLLGAMISFIVNVVMSILLMYKYGMYGLAWANVFAAFIQTVFLGWKFKKITKESFFDNDGLFFIPIVTASMFMYLILWGIEQFGFFGGDKLNEVFVLIFMISCGVIVYGAILFIFKFPELRNYSRKVRSFDFKNHD